MYSCLVAEVHKMRGAYVEANLQFMRESTTMNSYMYCLVAVVHIGGGGSGVLL